MTRDNWSFGFAFPETVDTPETLILVAKEIAESEF